MQAKEFSMFILKSDTLVEGHSLTSSLRKLSLEQVIPLFQSSQPTVPFGISKLWQFEKKYLEKFAAAKFESSFFFLLVSREDLLIWRRLINLVGKDGKEGQRSLIAKILMIARRIFESLDCI